MPSDTHVVQMPGDTVVDGSVERLGQLKRRRAEVLPAHQGDVTAPRLCWHRQGHGADEAESRVRALEHGIALVDDAGLRGVADGECGPAPPAGAPTGWPRGQCLLGIDDPLGRLMTGAAGGQTRAGLVLQQTPSEHQIKHT